MKNLNIRSLPILLITLFLISSCATTPKDTKKVVIWETSDIPRAYQVLGPVSITEDVEESTGELAAAKESRRSSRVGMVLPRFSFASRPGDNSSARGRSVFRGLESGWFSTCFRQRRPHDQDLGKRRARDPYSQGPQCPSQLGRMEQRRRSARLGQRRWHSENMGRGSRRTCQDIAA